MKTLDTVGAASDLGARVAKKVSGESETAGFVFVCVCFLVYLIFF